MSLRFSYLLKASKPQLWFATVWLYILPTAGLDVFGTVNFWVGLVYFIFPFNLLMRGLTVAEKTEIVPILTLQAPFLLYLGFQCWPFIIWWLVALWFVCVVKQSRFGQRAVPALLLSLGWLLPFNLSVKLNGLIPVPFETWMLLLLLAFSGQVIYGILSAGPEQNVATKKTVLIILLAGMAWLSYGRFDEPYFALLTGIFAALILTDLLFIIKNRPYPLKTVRIFTICANIAAAVTMVWLWHSGSLMM